MSKISLFGDTVLRKDGDQLYLMNRQEGGWRQQAIPVGSETEFLAKYNARLGEWSRDEHGEFCPVTCIPRSEQPTLHDMVEVGPTFTGKTQCYTVLTDPANGQVTLHDVGMQGVNGRMVPASALGVAMVDALEALYEEGAVEDKCFQPSKVQAGLQQFIDAHPGVRVGMGPGPFLVAIMPDGSAVAVDQDGTVVAEDELGS